MKLMGYAVGGRSSVSRIWGISLWQCSATAFLDVTTSGELGCPAKSSVPFGELESYSSASAIWKINPSGLGHRLEA